MNHLYIFSISILFTSYIIQSAEIELVQQPPSLMTRTKRCLGTRCARTIMCASLLLGVAGGIVAWALKYPHSETTPTPPPMTCHDYSQAFAYACNNICSGGFSLDIMCILPNSDRQSTETQLRTICPGGHGLEIDSYTLCTHRPQVTCRPWQPAIQRLNKTCNSQTTRIDPLRHIYRQKLATMKQQRKGA